MAIAVRSSAEIMRPVITAAAPPTALRIKKLRRSTPGGISCEVNPLVSASGSSGEASRGFSFSLFDMCTCSLSLRFSSRGPVPSTALNLYFLVSDTVAAVSVRREHPSRWATLQRAVTTLSSKARRVPELVAQNLAFFDLHGSEEAPQYPVRRSPSEIPEVRAGKAGRDRVESRGPSKAGRRAAYGVRSSQSTHSTGRLAR